MNKTAKLYITIITLITIAAIAIGLYIHVWDGGIGFSAKQVSDTVDVSNNITNVDIDADFSDITIEYGSAASVSYSIYTTKAPTIKENNGDLSIKIKQNNTFFLPMGNHENKLTVTIPNGTNLSNVRIIGDAGSVKLNDIIGNSVNLEADAGDIKCNNVTFNNFVVEADAGNVEFTDCKTDTLNVKLDAGNLNLKNSEIETITAEADAGNIESSDCTINGGSIETDMGNIELNGDIGQVSTKTDLGKVKINGSKK